MRLAILCSSLYPVVLFRIAGKLWQCIVKKINIILFLYIFLVNVNYRKISAELGRDFDQTVNVGFQSPLRAAMKDSAEARSDPCTVIEDLMVILAANEENHLFQGSGLVFDQLLYLEVIKKETIIII